MKQQKRVTCWIWDLQVNTCWCIFGILYITIWNQVFKYLHCVGIFFSLNLNHFFSFFSILCCIAFMNLNHNKFVYIVGLDLISRGCWSLVVVVFVFVVVVFICFLLLLFFVFFCFFVCLFLHIFS